MSTAVARRRALVTISVLGLLAVAGVGISVGASVAAEQTRNEGGWLTGWGPLVGVATAAVLALPTMLGLLGAALTGRSPRTAGTLLLFGGLGALVVGMVCLLASVSWGLVSVPVAVVCTLAFGDLSRTEPRSSVAPTSVVDGR
jgi:hypothetical protein